MMMMRAIAWRRKPHRQATFETVARVPGCTKELALRWLEEWVDNWVKRRRYRGGAAEMKGVKAVMASLTFYAPHTL